MVTDGNKLSSRSLFYFGKELYENEQFAEAVPYFYQYLDSNDGWVEDKIRSCYLLSICHEHLYNSKSRLKDLIRSFEYSTPRAEICCQLGWYYLQAQDIKKAIFWYDLATRVEKPEGWGFVLHDFWGFIPWLQLCVCYDKIGDIDKAIACNEKAAELKLDDPNVTHNNEYFHAMKCRQIPPISISSC